MEAMGGLQIFGLLLHSSNSPYVRNMILACIQIVPTPRNIFSINVVSMVKPLSLGTVTPVSGVK